MMRAVREGRLNDIVLEVAALPADERLPVVDEVTGMGENSEDVVQALRQGHLTAQWVEATNDLAVTNDRAVNDPR